MGSFIKFKDSQIHYSSTGKGNTIVLLHGFLESLEIWKDFSSQLSLDFQIISIDLSGHGKSPAIAETHSMNLMAESVKAVLDFLKIDRCVLIGHSMGGYATLAFADKYPETLNGFGLFHSHAGSDSEETRNNRDRTIQLIKKNRLGFIQMFIPDLFAPANRKKFDSAIQVLKKQAANTSKEGIIAALRGMKERPDRTFVIETSKHPVLFILGQEDMRIPMELALKQASLANRCEVEILKNVGHMGYIENENYTLNSIKYFAKKCFSSLAD